MSEPAIVPFRIAVSDAELADLHERLDRIRWPEPATVADGPDPWAQGVPLDYLRDVCDHWRHRYDWREREAQLNEVPQ